MVRSTITSPIIRARGPYYLTIIWGGAPYYLYKEMGLRPILSTIDGAKYYTQGKAKLFLVLYRIGPAGLFVTVNLLRKGF